MLGLSVAAIALLGGCEASWLKEVREDNFSRYLADAPDHLARIERACERGKAEACEAAAFIHLSGIGVPVSRQKGEAFSKAHCALVGCPQAGTDWVSYDLERFEKCWSGANPATPGDGPGRTKAQRERSLVCAVVGTSYLEGQGTDRDPKRGLGSIERACDLEREYRNAAALPATGSCAELGRVLLLGVGGVARNEHRAAAILREECDRGQHKGCSYLGLVSELGLAGEPRDIASAVKQYAPLCTYRDYFEGVVAGRPDPNLNVDNLIREPMACYRLGVLSLQGRGVPKNPHVAAHLFASLCVDAKLMELTCAPAAALYLHYGLEQPYPPTNGAIEFSGPIGGDGRGGRRDPESWARDACAAGSIEGCRVLRQIYAYLDEHSLAFDFREE